MQVRKVILISIIIVACLGAYFNTLFADFVWDDQVLIQANEYVKSFKFLPKFFTNDIWKVGAYTLDSGYYRPLLAASFMLDYSLWKEKPFGYHLTNLAFHILASILIFLLVYNLSRDNLISFFAALIFGTHPIHTESVSFISGRVDLITLTFLLLSLILFIRYAAGKKVFLYLLSLVCFFLALLVKEAAIIFPAILFCVDYFFISKCNIKNVIKNFYKFYLGFAIVLGLYFVIRSCFVSWPFATLKSGYSSNFFPGISPFWRFFTVIEILGFYIRLLFFPYAMKADYFFEAANSFFTPPVFCGAVLVLLFVFLAVKYAKKYPLLSFSIAWFFIAILPVSNIIPQGNIFAERYLYIPSVGFSIVAGFLFSLLLKKNVRTNFFNWQKTIFFLFFLLIIAFARVTFERNKVWHDNFSLWRETAAAEPASPRAHYNLALAYFKLNSLDKADEEVRKALKLNPQYYEGIILFGRIYFQKGYADDAINLYKFATTINPNRSEAYTSLAAVYGVKGRYKESIEAALMALKVNPYNYNAIISLALSYGNSGQIDNAIAAFEKYLETDPNNVVAQYNLCDLYYKKGNYQKAKIHCTITMENAKGTKFSEDASGLLQKINKSN